MKSPAQLQLTIEVFEKTRLRMIHEKDPQAQRRIGVELSNVSEVLLAKLVENELVTQSFLDRVHRQFLQQNPQYAEDTDDEG